MDLVVNAMSYCVVDCPTESSAKNYFIQIHVASDEIDEHHENAPPL